MWLQIGDASSCLPVSDCHLQDETANQILQCLTAAAQNRSPTEDMPSLSLRVSTLSIIPFTRMLLQHLLCVARAWRATIEAPPWRALPDNSMYAQRLAKHPGAQLG